MLGMFCRKRSCISALLSLRLSLKILNVDGLVLLPSRSKVSYLLKSSLEISKKSIFFLFFALMSTFIF